MSRITRLGWLLVERVVIPMIFASVAMIDQPGCYETLDCYVFKRLTSKINVSKTDHIKVGQRLRDVYFVSTKNLFF